VEEAIVELRKAISLDPVSADAHYNLGLLLAESGKAQQATLEWQETLRLKQSREGDPIEARLRGSLL
jgi:tetratricopeptide (TPR) repeat protein